MLVVAPESSSGGGGGGGINQNWLISSCDGGLPSAILSKLAYLLGEISLKKFKVDADGGGSSGPREC